MVPLASLTHSRRVNIWKNFFCVLNEQRVEVGLSLSASKLSDVSAGKATGRYPYWHDQFMDGSKSHSAIVFFQGFVHHTFAYHEGTSIYLYRALCFVSPPSSMLYPSS